jgi:hypothetical protein
MLPILRGLGGNHRRAGAMSAILFESATEHQVRVRLFHDSFLHQRTLGRARRGVRGDRQAVQAADDRARRLAPGAPPLTASMSVVVDGAMSAPIPAVCFAVQRGTSRVQTASFLVLGDTGTEADSNGIGFERTKTGLRVLGPGFWERIGWRSWREFLDGLPTKYP